MKVKESEHSSNFYADYEYDVVNSLSQESPCALNADNSLLLCAVWSKHNSLFDVLFSDGILMLRKNYQLCIETYGAAITIQ